MGLKNILIMSIVMVLFGATFGAIVGAVHGSSPSALPMPYGTRDLTHQSYLNRFIGVRTSNNVWYTFVTGNSDHETFYLNSDYPRSDVYAGKSNTAEDHAYFNFATAKVDHPTEVGNTAGQYWNSKDGVTGVLGVKIYSYANINGKMTLDLSAVTMFKDNYIENPSGSPLTTEYLRGHKGLVPDDYSNPSTRNYYYRSEIIIEKSNSAWNTTVSFTGPSQEGVTEYGLNAHPGTNIEYVHNGNTPASNLAKYLIMTAMETGTDAATGGWGEVFWIGVGACEAWMSAGDTGQNPWKTSFNGSTTPAYFNWAEKVSDEAHYAEQSITQNNIFWNVPPSGNADSEPFYLKIYAKFWYYEPTDSYGDWKYKSFITDPIYIYEIPKNVGVGIPTPPVPSGYSGAGMSYGKIWDGSKYDTMPIYNPVPTRFNAVINKKFTIKTADVAYGWNGGKKGGMLPAIIDYKIDWGDGTSSSVTSNTPNNGKEITASHIYKHFGYYTVRVRAIARIYDGWTEWGPWSRGTVIHVVDAFKTGPKAPDAGGTTFYTDSSGKAKITFKTSASTYAGSQIKYVFYW
ncbi:MAG: hypothetical protein GXO25_08320, partial [Euryarchaeota archaeon]|nr:hypothetical protein [Euryarchaeota archaeon]